MGKESATKDIKETSSKKRRRELSTSEKISNPFAIDEYKVVVQNEDEEAILRDPDQDLTLFCKASEEFRKLVAEIAVLQTTNTQQATAQIVEKRRQGALLFVLLKKLNRLEKFRMHQAREKLHKTRQQADSCHLQLQNLLYEVLHLKREVTKCLQFKSKVEDIVLVPLEQFYREAPASISRPEITKEDPHQLQLARLEWELKQRKELATLCNELKLEKKRVTADIKKKKTQLKNLAPMLKEILAVALPVQEMLGLSTGPPPAMQKAAKLLPHPLYYLFVQMDALREAGDKFLSVKVQGEEEDALRLKQTTDEAVTPEDSDSDTQEDSVAKRHRKKSRADKVEERKKQLLTAHPLTVVVDIKQKGVPASISLEFSYYVKLHVVTVKPTVKILPEVNLSSTSSSSKLMANENILVELFAEDYGDCSPNLANIYQLQQVGIESFNTAQLGLAYVWAQRVSGLSFPSVSDGEAAVGSAKQRVSQLYLPRVVKAIKKRLRTRISLCQQLQTLETKVIPNIPEVRKCFPQKLIVELTQWSSLSWVSYQALGFTQQVVDKGFVSERDIFYKGTLVRSNARLTMAVAIKNCYPTQPPVFTLQAAYGNNTTQAANNDSIRDIEREVNVFYDELLKKGPAKHILTAQILRLMTTFDILLEASTNQDFPRDKIFIQPNRGRNRAWPFKGVDRGDGIFHFTQR